MKTEILDVIEVEEPYFIYATLAIENDSLALLVGKHKLGEKPILQVKIVGSNAQLIDVSFLRGLNTHFTNSTLFAYKKGFGVIDHDHAKFYLWENLDETPQEITVLQRPSDGQLDLYENYLRYVSYDTTTDTFAIGVGAKHSPPTYAKWFAELTLETEIENNAINAYWGDPCLLKREDYPQTYFHYKDPELEWLNINDLISNNGKIYIISVGGQHTVGKSGKAFEFNVLAVYGSQNKLVKKLEMETGYGRFSTDKKYFIIQPNRKKRLLVYDLETLEVAHNIPLKTASNMGSIPIDYGVQGDLNNDLLYIEQTRTLNICKIIK